MILQQSDFEFDVKSLNDSNNMQRHVIIDNSPFPLSGGSLRKDISCPNVIYSLSANYIDILDQDRIQ